MFTPPLHESSVRVGKTVGEFKLIPPTIPGPEGVQFSMVNEPPQTVTSSPRQIVCWLWYEKPKNRMTKIDSM